MNYKTLVKLNSDLPVGGCRSRRYTDGRCVTEMGFTAGNMFQRRLRLVKVIQIQDERGSRLKIGD